METYLFIAAAVILTALAVIFYFINQKIKELKGESKNDQAFLLIQGQLNELTKAVDSKLAQTSSAMQTQMGESSKLIKDVTERLTKLDETNKQVINFADQLKNLQDILKNPKQRGVLGEYYLETVLKNVLPPGAYKTQYEFSDGKKVDAVVLVKDKIIPIDAKFSLENYNRMAEETNPTEKDRLEKVFVNDLKNRIQETSEYIRPQEGTLDFAFMFIPHEAIYYDLLINKIGALTEGTENLLQRAFSRYKVVIVSPTSFLAYLQTVMQGLKALKIEESVKDIIKRVGDLGKHVYAYDDHFKKLGKHLDTTVGAYNNAYTELKKIDKDVVKIAGGESQIEPLQLDKPKTE
jgi:DNA recombination protein RmuC